MSRNEAPTRCTTLLVFPKCQVGGGPPSTATPQFFYVFLIFAFEFFIVCDFHFKPRVVRNYPNQMISEKRPKGAKCTLNSEPANANSAQLAQLRERGVKQLASAIRSTEVRDLQIGIARAKQRRSPRHPPSTERGERHLQVEQ